MNFYQISYNDHTLFHILRHFECTNYDARICLKDRGYTDDEILENLEMPGSKFNTSFATDIKTLMSQLELGKIIQIQERKKYQEILIGFNNRHFPDGIGTLGVCNRNELSALNATIPILKLNRGMQLWHAVVAQIPITHQLTIVIKKQSNAHFLITAFPGLPALPLPQMKMKPLELELSKLYWKDKVFLEKHKEVNN